MSVLAAYLNKHALYPPFVNCFPAHNLNAVVVIPCYNEPNVVSTLQSIYNCNDTEQHVEVLLIINQSENDSIEVKANNQKTYNEVVEWISIHKKNNLSFFIIKPPDFPVKHAGVGLARKVGMDEAVRRFDMLNNSKGVIVGYDADCLCELNYLTEIENKYKAEKSLIGTSIYFEHPILGSDYSIEIYNAIYQYELYLRYYLQALRYCGYPFAYHTVGSSFSVNVLEYCRQGGMNKRKAGEDFYFLSKIIPNGNYAEINTTCVYPSPRKSNRVPFGTGAEIIKIVDGNINDYETYAFEAFNDLKDFFVLCNKFYEEELSKNSQLLNIIPKPVFSFLEQIDFIKTINEIKSNTSNYQNFKDRFFRSFNAFTILKFLNYSHTKFYSYYSVTSQAQLLLNFINIKYTSNILELYRGLEKNVD